jgi:hypothetical protein
MVFLVDCEDESMDERFTTGKIWKGAIREMESEMGLHDESQNIVRDFGDQPE